MRMSSRTIALAITMLALSAGPAVGQILRDTIGGGMGGAPRDPDQAWSFSVSPRTEYLFDTGFDGAGDIGTWSNGLSVGVRRHFGPATRVGLDLGYEHRQYFIDRDMGLLPPSNKPFETVHTYTASASIFQAFDRKWGMFLRGGTVMSASHDVDPTDGINWNVILGAGYRCSETFTGGVGVVALGRFEEDLLVVPGIFIDWQFLEEWNLRLQGPSFSINWDPEQFEDWQFGMRANFEGRRFRLEDGPVRNSGIVADRALPIEVYAVWQPQENTAIELRVGANAWRELEFMDRDGDEFRSFTADPQAFVGLSVNLSF